MILVYVLLLLVVLFLLYKMLSVESKENFKHTNFGTVVHPSIDLRYVSGLLSKQECEHLISLAVSGLQRSKVITNTDHTYNADRTSYSYYLDKHRNDPIVKAISTRISSMTGKAENTLEDLQVVRYEPTQEFKQHYDWFQSEYRDKINNQREYTFFVYLNDVEEGAGGETFFPNLNLRFRPKLGDALFWENCSTLTICHTNSLHQGLPPTKGIKYGLNIWINFNPLR